MRKVFIFCAVTVLAGSIQSCAHVDYRQMTYKALRQQDCLLNELQDFCARNFLSEYKEYERVRNQYLQEQNDAAQSRLEEQHSQVLWVEVKPVSSGSSTTAESDTASRLFETNLTRTAIDNRQSEFPVSILNQFEYSDHIDQLVSNDLHPQTHKPGFLQP